MKQLLAAALFASIAVTAGAADMKLGLQAWTYNNLTLFQTIARAEQLDVHYLEAYPGQKIAANLPGDMGPDLDEATRQAILARAKAAHVKISSLGVTDTNGEAGWRKLFAFAKSMGITNIAAEPKASDLPLLDKLTAEYGITIAIHNHPQPSPYWNPDTVLAAVKNCGPRIGACADTGHWVRSGLDAVDCLKKLEGRIIELHFKDLNIRDAKGCDVPWGTGACNAAGQIAELKRQKFAGIFFIEYEHATPELMANLRACMEFFNKAVGN